MRQFLNQHSYVLVALVIAGAAYAVVRRLRGRRRMLSAAVVLAVLVAGILALRTPPGNAAELDRVLGRGKPVALEFYSNF